MPSDSDPPRKVFISSVMNNFKRERQSIAKVIIKSENTPIYAENIVETNKPSKKVIENAVRRCDCYIGIFHKRWGWVPPKNNPDKLSVTAIEYETAKEEGLPPLILVSTSKKEKELTSFLKRIGEYEDGEWLNRYDTLSDLAGIVGLKIKELVHKKPTKPTTKPALKQKISDVSTKFKNLINYKIGTIYETPKNYKKIFEGILKENCWIVGERGIGKSSILRKIIEDLQNNGNTVLFLRAEEIISKKNFQNITKDEFGLSLNEIISEITKKEEFYLIIDSIDAIQRNPEAWNSFSAEVKAIQSNPKMRTVLAVRKSDYDAFEQFDRNWGKEVVITGFTESQVKKIFSKLGIKDKISSNLLPIFSNPFYLDILAKLINKSKFKIVPKITNQYKFFLEHYNRVIRNNPTGQLASEKTSLLEKIANKMVELKRFKIFSTHFPPSDAFQSLRSDGVLIERDSFLEFFHQMYFDFIMTLSILKQGKISKYLEKIEEELFLHSTINFTLGYLRTIDHTEFLNNVNDLLKSDKLSYYWKLLVLEFFASLNSANKKEQETLSVILDNDPSLQGQFLKYLIDKKNPIWYNYWADNLFTKWASDSQFQQSLVLAQYISVANEVNPE
ncbi:MAG: DUF4062 domain-containing protein [Nitrosopumilaceae archaeon]